MNQFEQFNKAIQVSEVTSNQYTLKPDTNYFVGNTPHGGYLMAIMHKTLVTVLPLSLIHI